MGSLTDTQGIVSAEFRAALDTFYPFQLAVVIYDLLKIAIDYTVGLLYQG